MLIMERNLLAVRAGQELDSYGAPLQIDLLGAAGVRANKQLTRIVNAAVQGRAVRTGRQAVNAA